MLEIIGLILSFVFIFTVIGFSALLMRTGLVTPSVSRKIIHIGVSNWWILAMFTMQNVWIAAIGPFVFIVLNYASYRLQLLPAMNEAGKGGNLGTVYFPVSLLVLVFFCFGGVFSLAAGAAGILTMGYADGFAALIGEKFGKGGIQFGRFRSLKTPQGTITMYIVSVFVLLMVYLFLGNETQSSGLDFTTSAMLGTAAGLGFFATVVEFFTPKGLDNITVPIFTALVYGLIIG